MNLTNIVMISILIEALISYAKQLFVDRNLVWQQLVSLIIGIFVALSFSVDLPAAFGMKSLIPCVGQVITGIIFSRGSNYVADLLRKLQNSTEPDPEKSAQSEKTL